MKTILVALLVAGLTTLVLAKLPKQTRNDIDTHAAAAADSAGAFALDSTQNGLQKANDALAKARSESNKRNGK